MIFLLNVWYSTESYEAGKLPNAVYPIEAHTLEMAQKEARIMTFGYNGIKYNVVKGVS